MKIFIVLLALVIVSGSNYQHKLNYTKKRSLTAVMTEVENKIKSHSPLIAVLNILTDFKEAVQTEQVNHDEIYQLQVSECQSEFQYRSAEIQNAQTLFRDSSASLNVCEASKNRATERQQVNQQQTFNFESHLNTVLATAETEKVYFQKRSRQYEDSLQLIDEALEILQQLYNGYGSFVQLSSLSKDMLQISFETKLTAKYAPLFYVFSELAKQGDSFDQSLLEQAQHLLYELRSTIQNAYDQFSESNGLSVAHFNNQKEKVNKVLARLSAQRERLQNKIDKQSNCIGVQTAIVNTAASKLERNTVQLNQATTLCETFDREYSVATTARRNEIQLVSELEKMVIQRFQAQQDVVPRPQFVRLNY